jgi:hypothetical protein
MQQPLENDSREPAPTRAASDLRIVRPDNPCLALGLAASHLMTKPALAALRFGERWRVPVGQINRKQLCFDSKKQVHGFLGWALTSKDKAEASLEGCSGSSSQDSSDGDCIIFNALASSSTLAKRLLMIEGRKAMTGKQAACFKRHYPDGSTRASRLAVNEFVDQHIERGG